MPATPPDAVLARYEADRQSRRGPGLTIFLVLGILLFGQSLWVVDARFTELITGVHGMADFLSRSWPPDLSDLRGVLWPALETIDIALFGTVMGVILAIPFAILAARNVTPSPYLYGWALLFVTAVGLGPFPGALALSVHSIGMLGRLFAEIIEDMDMGPVEALTLTGAGRAQIFSQAVVPGVLPSLLGIALYRFDENLRSSLVLGFVGAGGIGFQLLTAMNLFQYRSVSTLLIVTFCLVIGAERLSSLIRSRMA